MAFPHRASRIEAWLNGARIGQRVSALKKSAVHWAFQLFPHLATAALEIRSAGLTRWEIPKIFSTNLRELATSLNEDLLDQFGRSEQLLANRFSFLHHSEEFGPEIDWEFEGSAAWRAELHAFDYALDLALTYRISLEDRYARHLRYLIADWIASNPPGEGTGWLLPPLARRIRNWILAADLARQNWESDAEFLQLLARSLAFQASYLLLNADSARFTPAFTSVALALLLSSRLFPGIRNDEFRFKALSVLHQGLEAAVFPDGGAREARPTAQLSLATALLECHLQRGTGGTASDSLKDKLCGVLDFLESILMPDFTLPLFGPSARLSTDALSELFALGAVVFNEPAWKSIAGGFGVFPYFLFGEEGKAVFECLPAVPWRARNLLESHNGLFRLANAESSAMVINGHRPQLPADHEDYLTYELAIQGQRFVVDSGALDPEEEFGNSYFASPRAHNVLLVDGQGSRATAFETGPPDARAPALVEGAQGLCLSDCGFRFLGLARARGWYALENNAWAVVDRLEGRGRHAIVSLLHLYPTFEVEIKGSQALARSRTLAFTIIPLGESRPKITVSQGDDAGFPGWYAPDFGVKYSARVLALSWTRVEVPWLGGCLIVPGLDPEFQSLETDTQSGTLRFELGGKSYLLAAHHDTSP